MDLQKAQKKFMEGLQAEADKKLKEGMFGNAFRSWRNQKLGTARMGRGEYMLRSQFGLEAPVFNHSHYAPKPGQPLRATAHKIGVGITTGRPVLKKSNASRVFQRTK
jgi:hypothetical protein